MNSTEIPKKKKEREEREREKEKTNEGSKGILQSPESFGGHFLNFASQNPSQSAGNNSLSPIPHALKKENEKEREGKREKEKKKKEKEIGKGKEKEKKEEPGMRRSISFKI